MLKNIGEGSIRILWHISKTEGLDLALPLPVEYVLYPLAI